MRSKRKTFTRKIEGPISEAQLRGLIKREAQKLDLTFDQAIERAKERTLPRTYLGDDLSLLIQLLPA